MKPTRTYQSAASSGAFGKQPHPATRTILQAWLQNLVVFGVLGLLVSGCSMLPTEPKPNDPAYAPVEPSALEAARLINGSIYQAPLPRAYSQATFFEDRTARNVGDILTISLVESTTAKKEADTEIKKDSTLTAPEPTLFQRFTDLGLETSASNKLNFKGETDSDQKNSLQGSISVTVIEVLPNGVLKVRGEKWMTLNKGDEYIRISGLVRPEDIAPDNTVASIKLADARIAYSQTGTLAHANGMGWFSKFFNSPLWPF